MKKTLCILLALCLLLAGCHPTDQNPTEDSVPSTSQTQTTEAEETEINLPKDDKETETWEENVTMGNTGKRRIDYTGQRSSVQYITDAASVPDYPELEGYDVAYFENHALLLVIDTENSGSVQVEIGSIQVKDGVASVTISRTMDGDVGTTDMATWLLWVEVETGLEYEWTIANAVNDTKVYRY